MRQEKRFGPGTRRNEPEQVITFRVGRETYGVPIDRVHEVIAYHDLLHPSDAPAFIAGILALRGTQIPVVDLGTRLALKRHKVSKQPRILVLEVGEELIGVTVDAVSEVVLVEPAQCEQVNKVVGDDEYETGPFSHVAKVGSNLIILLSPEGLLRPEEREELHKLARSIGR